MAPSYIVAQIGGLTLTVPCGAAHAPLLFRGSRREFKPLAVPLRWLVAGELGPAAFRSDREAEHLMDEGRCAGMSLAGTARTCPLASIAIASTPASVRRAVPKL